MALAVRSFTAYEKHTYLISRTERYLLGTTQTIPTSGNGRKLIFDSYSVGYCLNRVSCEKSISGSFVSTQIGAGSGTGALQDYLALPNPRTHRNRLYFSLALSEAIYASTFPHLPRR